MTADRTCRNCSAPLPEGVLQGLCGRCLAQLALGEESVAGPATASPPHQQAEPGRYEVHSKIAQGGMGEVLEARDLHFGRSVAMKVIRGERGPTKELRLRFVQEARVLSRLEHPNIVPVYDLDKDEQGRVFYTMKKVQGVTLKEVINRLKTGNAEAVEEYSLSQLLTIFQKVCDAVGFAHSKGVVHRDLKPENVMVGEFGEVLVMDWGLAKVLNEGRDALPRVRETEGRGAPRPDQGEEGFQEMDDLRPPSGDGGYDLTLEGTVMGTPQFMAPEQAEGRIADIDERTDIFSLGGILYSLLTLRPPTGGTTVNEVLANIKTGYIPPPIFYNKARRLAADGTELEMAIALAHCPGGHIPDSLSAVAMKAMAVEAAERYQTVPELQAEIAAYQGGFATGAERAGAFRQLWLLVLRHKAVFGIIALAVVIVLTLGLGLGIRITKERNRANATLADLRKAVPLMRSEIDSLMAAHKFAEALPKAEYICSLLPNDAESLVLKGNLLQSLLRFEEAERACQAALRLAPDNKTAAENLTLCRKLAPFAGKGGKLGDEDFLALQLAMSKQGRYAEAAAMMERGGKSRQQLFKKWKAQLEAARPEIGVIFAFHLQENGLAVLILDNVKGTNLLPLTGLPIERLQIRGGPELRNIAALRGMPLSALTMVNTRVADLTPLRGMPLKQLMIGYSPISDLSPLAGMPLEDVDLQADDKLHDISPLQGMQIKRLLLSGSPIIDLNPVKGMPLTELNFGACKVRSLEPIRGMSIASLEFDSQLISDLSPLLGMPLTNLQVLCPLIKDVRPLQGMNLRRLVMRYARVEDLQTLKGMPLVELDLEQTKVQDLRPLAGMPLEVLDLSQTPISDLRPLRGMPLRELRLEGCSSVADLAPLADCKELERLTIPMYARNVELLRNLPRLRKLAYALPNNDWNKWDKIPPVEEFWEAQDAKKRKK